MESSYRLPAFRTGPRLVSGQVVAAVLAVANDPDSEYPDILTAYESVRAAFDDTIPQSLVELRPQEPAQMAARFVLTELQPLIDAHARALEESC